MKKQDSLRLTSAMHLIFPILSLLTPALVSAQSTTGRTFRSTTGSGLSECRDHYFPLSEIRVMNDIPINFMFFRDQGVFRATPVVGLDVLGLWISPVRPSCKTTSSAADFEAPELGSWLSFVASFSGGYMAYETQTSRTDAGTGMTVSEEAAAQGIYASFNVAAYFVHRWYSGGHGNQLGIGAMARVGYFIGDPASRLLVTYGPAITLSLF